MGSAVLGAAAVLGAIASFGSFGVPIKSRRLQEAQVHPIVVQGYKSAACFATCWLALLVVPLRFTWWGTLGAAIWVLNGIAAIVAIQAAGLAVSQALWSGLSVFVSFIWGAAVFRERVRSLPLAIAGLCLMAAGMAAVGVISGSAATAPQAGGGKTAAASQAEAAATDSEMRRLVGGGGDDGGSSSAEGTSRTVSGLQPEPPPGELAASGVPASVIVEDPAADVAASALSGRASYGAGIACAVYVGLANGSFLVPLKYANHTVTGLEYLASFGVGAVLVTAIVAAAYSAIAPRLQQQKLDPKWRAAAAPALLAGLLWSAGNFFGIIATQELGLALAWPACQAQLLVSTAWGALYYGEVRGRRAFAGLLAGSAAVVAGVAALAAAKG